MRDLVILFIHLITTVARLASPGGIRSVVAESVSRQTSTADPQSLAPSRSQSRFSDRLVAGRCALFMRPSRLIRSAIVPTGTGHRGSILADFPWTPEGQPLECSRVSVRISHVADSLGPSRHGSIHAPHPGVRRPCRSRRRCRTLPDVQPRNSRATRDAQVHQLRPRSPLSV
jgi:hypothetical protein